MTIETKYNIGDKVWFMYNNSVKSAIIIKINVVIGKNINHTGMHKTTMYGLYDCVGYEKE